MDERGLVERVFEELAESALPGRQGDLVLAAVLGDDELTAALAGELDVAPPSAARPEPPPPTMFLQSISVEGFRGVAEKTTLGLTPGPGLTLVVGRNGSGKSSFADGAELALTGTTMRWEGRSKAWQEGWANIHHDGPRAVEVRLAVEGLDGQTTVRRNWGPADALGAGKATAQRPGSAAGPVASLGLDQAFARFRPFLPYSELAGLLEEGPTKLYGAIASVLGLEELVVAADRLTGARKVADDTVKRAKRELSALVPQLAASDDERAGVALAEAKKKVPDLDAVEALATGVGAVLTDSDTTALEAAAVLRAPAVDEVAAATEELRSARLAEASVTRTEAGRARHLADLLEAALTTTTVGTCPVCGTSDAIDDGWAERTRQALDRLRQDGAAADAAAQRVGAAERACEALRRSFALPEQAPGFDLDALRGAAADWHGTPLDDLAEAAPALTDAAALVRVAAQEELRRRTDRWQPLAATLAAWLPTARDARRLDPLVKDLKQAGEWLTGLIARVRDERFAPISAKVREVWDRLRQDSSVSIDAVELTGKGNHRRVALRVSVDGSDSAGLAVMSQGELHAVALSLFLPRATLPQSPFRFLVIDDPVQAMDAARVDGLARTLDEAAVTHQVVVFTHDERLPEACRRLDVRARVLEVTRGDHSQISIRRRLDPTQGYLEDARSVLRTDGYPVQARRRVVPGLCRNAVEAACLTVIRRRRITAGHPHHTIEELLDQHTKLVPRLALALWDAADKADDVYAWANKKFGSVGGDTVRALNVGAHELIDTDPDALIRATEKLADAVLAQP